MLVSRLCKTRTGLAIAACLSFGFLSCSVPQEPVSVAYQIMCPVTDWKYFDDEPVIFDLNVDAGGVKWDSSIDGPIGFGNCVTKYLSPGTHVITATLDGIELTRDITVTHREYAIGDEISVSLNGERVDRRIPANSYYPYAVSCGLGMSGLRISSTTLMGNQNLRNTSLEPLRDFRVHYRAGNPVSRNDRAVTRAIKMRALGDTRAFRVLNTARQYDDPKSVTASLVYISDGVYAWSEVGTDETTDAIKSVCAEVDKIVVPRVRSIWGEWGDIDGNGRIDVLFVKSINDEGVAIGFFNPSDFFAYDADVNSQSYNPTSNEMDILYLAMPVDDPTSSYSRKSIAATVAHELTHAVNFTRKTWNRQIAGNLNAPQEELFLDEGWSHLSESLCGYGVSGGNLKFLNAYLADTSRFSLCGKNALGQDDSAGRRGGMALFLYWLFQRKGGMAWSDVDSVMPVDKGGIGFLKAMTASSSIGWEGIGAAYGETTRALYLDFVKDMNSNRPGNVPTERVLDPITDEPITIAQDMGSITVNGVSIDISPAKSFSVPIDASVDLMPWSFMLFSPITFSDSQDLSVSHFTSDADGFISFLVY